MKISIFWFNSLRPRQMVAILADDIFKWIFLNENVIILIEISLKSVPKGPINNIPALVQIMAWRRPGDKPLSEPMMVRLPTHICVTLPQWVKFHWHFVLNSPVTDKLALVQVMARHRTGDKPLSEPMIAKISGAASWCLADTIWCR